MAYNVSASMRQLKHVMTTSLLKTLAAKHKTSTSKIALKYATTLTTPDGRYKVFQVPVQREGKPPLVATWGGISLKWSKSANIDETRKLAWKGMSAMPLDRLLANTREVCGSHDRVANYHVRRLQRGRGTMPVWQRIMISRQRKRSGCVRTVMWKSTRTTTARPTCQKTAYNPVNIDGCRMKGTTFHVRYDREAGGKGPNGPSPPAHPTQDPCAF